MRWLNLQNRDKTLKPLSVIEEEVIQHAIKHCETNMTLVAERLGIGRSTLYRKLKVMREKRNG